MHSCVCGLYVQEETCSLYKSFNWRECCLNHSSYVAHGEVSEYVAVLSGFCFFSLPFSQLYSWKNTIFIWLLPDLWGKLGIVNEICLLNWFFGCNFHTLRINTTNIWFSVNVANKKFNGRVIWVFMAYIFRLR